MGMAGVGTGVGAGIRGYYGAKKARNDSEATDAAMRIQELEDQLRELEQANEVAKIPEQAARDRHAADMEKRKRAGETVRADHELPRAVREEKAAVRADDISDIGHAGAREAAKNTLPQAVRTEAIAGEEHKGKMVTAGDSENKARRGIAREEQVAGQETSQVEAQQIVQAVPGVIAAARASGSPAPIDDFYAESLPNGHTVTTTEDPNVPGGYILTDNMGNEKKASNLEEIIVGFEKSFTSQEMVDKMLGRGNLGREPGQYRPDVGGIRSRYGSSGTGGRGGTQLERMYPQVVEDLAKQYPEMEVWERRLTAIKFLKERGGEPSDVFRRKWTADMMEVIMGMSDIGGKKKKAMGQFWEMSELLFGEEGSKPKPDGPVGDDETTDDWYE